jgi:hypothetical protein
VFVLPKRLWALFGFMRGKRPACAIRVNLALLEKFNELRGRRPQGLTVLPRPGTGPLRGGIFARRCRELSTGKLMSVPVAGDIKLMPGTASGPAFRDIDIDVETGKVKGLF